MRPRSPRRPRTALPLDLSKYYAAGLAGCLLAPFERNRPTDPDFEVRFCQDILNRAPDHPEALALLGETYTRRGDYAKGLETDLRLSHLRPMSAAVHYNLACSYALLGQREQALEILEQAVALGYADLDHLRDDGDLEALRDDPRYRALLTELTARTQETRR